MINPMLSSALMGANIPAYSRGDFTDPRLAIALAAKPQPTNPGASAFAPPPQQQAPRPVVPIGPKTDSLARALIGGATSSQPSTPFEALGKLAQLWSGNRQQDKFVEAQAAREKAAKQEEEQQAMAKLGKFQELVKSGLSPQEAALQTGVGADEAIKSMFDKPAERAIKNDANGIPRYVDSGEAVFGVDNNPESGGGVFGGKSVEAQALNILIENKTLTKEQAAQIGAGKVITGPDGRMYFMTPQGIFSGTSVQDAQPVVPSGGAAPAATTGTAPMGDTPDAVPGMIPLTGAKTYGTDEQTRAAGFVDRMANSGSIIDKFENVGTELGNTLASKVPLAGNYIVSDEFRQLDQAKRDFINAQLRRESGAAIQPSEFENANAQYFPQPGDDPATLAQKRKNRQLAVSGMKRSAGPLNSNAGQPPAPELSGGGASQSGPNFADPSYGFDNKPSDVDPEVWKFMTPEQKALWQ